MVEHAGDTVAALKAITPERTPSAQSPQALARERETRRKRDGHAQQMAAVRSSVEARAAQDDRLSTRAQIVLQLLLNVAGARDWCRPGIAALAHLAAELREQGLPPASAPSSWRSPSWSGRAI